MSGKEAQLQPAEDVIHDGLGIANLLAASPAGGLKASVGEFFAQNLERNAVLKRERDRSGKRIHEPGNGGTFLGHLDEDFTRLPVGVKTDRDVAFVAGDGELMRQ